MTFDLTLFVRFGCSGAADGAASAGSLTRARFIPSAAIPSQVPNVFVRRDREQRLGFPADNRVITAPPLDTSSSTKVDYSDMGSSCESR